MPTRAACIALVLVLASALAGCGDDDGDEAAPTAMEATDTAASSEDAGGGDDGAATTTTGPEADAPEVFTGPVEDFYVLPDPPPAGEPGDLIRTQEPASGDGVVNLRIMYLSEDAEGRDRGVTGLLTYPTAEAPADGWPVISTAHGTTGIAPQCALSRSLPGAQNWGVEGVQVMTDYVGQGPVGELHPYLSKPAEGNAVIDAVRAARQVPEAHASARWVSIGHSQGGHGALAAHELAAERAPGLELVATVALAPGALLDGGSDDG